MIRINYYANVVVADVVDCGLYGFFKSSSCELIDRLSVFKVAFDVARLFPVKETISTIVKIKWRILCQ